MTKEIIFFLIVLLNSKVCLADRPWEACTSIFGKKGAVTVYQNRYFGGWAQCYTFQNDECITLEDWWSPGRVSSVNSHGTCVRLYEGSKCNGMPVEISPGSLSHNNLNELNFEDLTRSISTCKGILSTPPPNDYEKCKSSDCSGKKACVTIYQHRDFSGYAQCYPFEKDECRLTTTWFRNRISSVSTHNTCIRLHEQLDCRGLSLDIYPGSFNHGDLSLVNFEDVAQSISTCNVVPNNTQCTVHILFSQFIESEKVAKASQDIASITEEIISISYSALGLVIPGVELLHSGLKIISDIINPEVSVEIMIDAKIDRALARKSGREIAAKIHAINSRVLSLVNASTPEEYRKVDLIVALNTCEEVYHLFNDQFDQDGFSGNKLVSSPYLVPFSSIYLVVAQFVRKLRPDMTGIVGKMEKLTELNKSYMREAIIQRKEKFTLEDKSYKSALFTVHGYIVTDGIRDCKEFGDCNKYKWCNDLVHCEICQNLIGSNIETEMENFFTPIINKLEKFA